MSVVVAGHWEIGYMAPIMESNHWNLVCRDFKVDRWLMNPVSGIRNNEQKRIELVEFPDYETMLDSCKELTRVFLEPKTNHFNPDTTWLHDFEHPTDCVYVFGSAHYNPTLSHYRDGDVIVSVKTANDKGVLWANQTLAIVLYDRMIKW